MRRFRRIATDILQARPHFRRRSEDEPEHSIEIERLRAEYTGSFARNAGQEIGVLPSRYERK
jgi:hypothetical protein